MEGLWEIKVIVQIQGFHTPPWTGTKVLAGASYTNSQVGSGLSRWSESSGNGVFLLVCHACCVRAPERDGKGTLMGGGHTPHRSHSLVPRGQPAGEAWGLDAPTLRHILLFCTWGCVGVGKKPRRMTTTAGVCSAVSDHGLWPHRLQPIRLLCPWDFLGKNTGVGRHFLLQGIYPTQGSNLCLLHWLRFFTMEPHTLP